MVVGQPHQDELGHGVSALSLIGDPALQMADENLGSDLVGDHQVEVRRLLGKMADEFRLGGDIGGNQRHRPRPLVYAAAPLRGKSFARRNGFMRAIAALHQRPHLRIGDARFVAKSGGDVLAEMVIGLAVRGQIAPEITAGRLVHIGNLLQQRIVVGDCALVVVGALAAAITLRPGLFQIVGTDARRGPDVPVAGNFTGIEEVVEHAKLQGELVLVGRDAFAEHGYFRIAIAHRLSIPFEVTKNLIVGAVFLDDVNHVVNAILRFAGEDNLLLGCFHAVGGDYHAGPLRQVSVNLRCVECSQRAIEKRGDVRGWPRRGGVFRGLGGALGEIVRPGALAFIRSEIEPAAGG